jgi:hypothetical protein
MWNGPSLIGQPSVQQVPMQSNQNMTSGIPNPQIQDSHLGEADTNGIRPFNDNGKDMLNQHAQSWAQSAQGISPPNSFGQSVMQYGLGKTLGAVGTGLLGIL